MRTAIVVVLFSGVSLQITFALTPNEKTDEQSLRNAESSLLKVESAHIVQERRVMPTR